MNLISLVFSFVNSIFDPYTADSNMPIPVRISAYSAVLQQEDPYLKPKWPVQPFEFKILIVTSNLTCDKGWQREPWGIVKILNMNILTKIWIYSNASIRMTESRPKGQPGPERKARSHLPAERYRLRETAGPFLTFCEFVVYLQRRNPWRHIVWHQNSS